MENLIKIFCFLLSMNLVLETRQILTFKPETSSECQCYKYYFPEIQILEQQAPAKDKKVIMVF